VVEVTIFSPEEEKDLTKETRARSRLATTNKESFSSLNMEARADTKFGEISYPRNFVTDWGQFNYPAKIRICGNYSIYTVNFVKHELFHDKDASFYEL
jgi:hypothetical protein